MKKIAITIAIVTLTIIACKKKGQYCWNEAEYPGVFIYKWDHNSAPSNAIKKFEDSCGCKLKTSVKCVPCETTTDIHGNDIDCN